MINVVLNQEETRFLQKLVNDYAIAISDGLAMLGNVYDALASLEEDGNSVWLSVNEVLAAGQEAGEALSLFNRFVDQHRGDWEMVTGFNPLFAYELGCVVAESLVICHMARTPEGALALPIVGIERLSMLFTGVVQQWIDSVIAAAGQAQLPAGTQVPAQAPQQSPTYQQPPTYQPSYDSPAQPQHNAPGQQPYQPPSDPYAPPAPAPMPPAPVPDPYGQPSSSPFPGRPAPPQ